MTDRNERARDRQLTRTPERFAPPIEPDDGCSDDGPDFDDAA
jgi:hypothetical protein